jgi:hypothetical protein
LHIFRIAVLTVSAFSAAAADSPAVLAGYTNYIGDSNEYQTTALATDANGNTFVTGSRTILLPGTGASLTDIFVAKVDYSGNPTVLATLSGKGGDQANGIALDPAGNIYIVGSTTSPDFPLHHPLQSVNSHGSIGGTGFLVKMTSDGTVPDKPNEYSIAPVTAAAGSTTAVATSGFDRLRET